MPTSPLARYSCIGLLVAEGKPPRLAAPPELLVTEPLLDPAVQVTYAVRLCSHWREDLPALGTVVVVPWHVSLGSQSEGRVEARHIVWPAEAQLGHEQASEFFAQLFRRS